MADTIFGIDKGMIKAFGLLIVIVGSLTTFFLSEYIANVVLGSVYFTAVNGTTHAYTTVTAEALTADNTTARQLGNYPIVSSTYLQIYNSSGTAFDLSYFTITYSNASILVANSTAVGNSSALLANYTYSTASGTSLAISSDAETFVGTAEDDFVTTFTYVNTGIKFAAALITVVAVILIFASFLPKGGKGKTMDY